MEARAAPSAPGRLKRVLAGTAFAAAGTFLASCVWIAQNVRVQSLTPADATTVENPVKAHLADGSTVVFTDGVTVEGGGLRGVGDLYNPALTDSDPVYFVPLEDVVAMESFTTDVRTGESILVSSLATAGTAVTASAIILALFGSCPTVYSSDGEVEEAELFSSSIAPLFEARDVDRLRAQPGPDHTLTLEVRNEAMETHYINNLQILEVVHVPGERVLPGPAGRPLIVGPLAAPLVVRDRIGRDVTPVLATGDGEAYATDASVIDGAAEDDLLDWLQFTAPVPAGAEEIALAFRMRNSLLGTVLLYDVMLGPMGAEALDWIGSDLGEISTAVELGRWLEDRAGLHVSVRRDGEYREIARVPDSGPISWHDVAVRIPVEPGETALDVRLSFMPDHWRIDQLGVAASVREGVPNTIDLAQITDRDGNPDAVALERLRETDSEYLETRPGQNFFAHFSVGEIREGQARTFLLSSLGYYIEWIRGDWIRDADPVMESFDPDDDMLLEALRQWRDVRDEFEERFRRERVPVGGA